MRPASWPALAAILLACTPRVEVAAPEPIVINLNISHEVRVKIDSEVREIIGEEERARRGIASRSLDGAALSTEDAARVSNAKTSGLLGERPDGYLGVVSGGAGASTEDLVQRVNAARRREYEKLAAQTGTPVEAVGSVAGARRIAEAPAGVPVMDAQGRWSEATP